MQKFFARVLLGFYLVAVAGVGARADGPDDQYVVIYTMIQQADGLAAKGDRKGAETKYMDAQMALKHFQTDNPGWNVKVVNFRLRYLTGKIEEFSPQNVGGMVETNGPVDVRKLTNIVVPPPMTNAASGAVVAPAPTGSDTENQIKSLQEQLRQSEGDKAMLEAKLKEALGAQPAAVDPKELQKAVDQIKALQKENDLLKISLADAKTNLSAVTNAQKTQQQMAELNTRLSQATEANAILLQEKTALQNQLKANASIDSATAALREENAILKKQVADLQASNLIQAPNGDTAVKMQAAQAQIAALQSDKEILRMEKMALQNRLAQSMATPVTNAPVMATNSPAPAVVMDSVAADKIAQLEHERDELQKSLEDANRKLYGKRKGKDASTRIEEMTRQLAALRSRIDIMEAHPVPYTADELALLSQPDSSLKTTIHSGKKVSRPLPASATPLLAQAENYFKAREFDKAEATYLQILKLDDKNPATLTGLASIELELNRPDQAETYLNSALTTDPDNDFALYTLGRLKFGQKKYDEALNALSRAAQINPTSPQIQNLLGLTLSEKGLRGPAETAFRRAIQADPAFGDAHNNLAFVYATQQPPLLELARWHYQKALAAGYPPNPKLEKYLEPAGSITNTNR